MPSRLDLPDQVRHDELIQLRVRHMVDEAPAMVAAAAELAGS